MATVNPACHYLVGHRGAAGEAPENTLGGFQYATQLGLQHFELDIHLSADGKLVVLHDDTVDRTTFCKGRVNQFTACELAQMDARRNTPPWPQREGIPLLDDVISCLQPCLQSIQLEVKPPDKKSVALTCERLIELIESRNLRHTAIVTSSDQRFLRAMHELAPGIRRGYVAERGDPLPVIDKHQCSYLIPDWRLCHPKLIAEAHDRKVMVSVWTVNDSKLATQLFQWGVDSLITDFPSRLLPVITQLLFSDST